MSLDLVWKHTLQSHYEIKESILSYIDLYDQIGECTDKITKTDFFDPNRRSQYMDIFFNSEGAELLRQDICQKYGVTNFYTSGCWFQQYHNNDSHGWHLHGKNTVSMSYLLELDDSKHSTEFVDIEKKKTFQLNVSEGDVIIFPSHIIHRSPIITSDGRKTTIAINLDLGEPNIPWIDSIS
tara:strand:- start:40 stop:582 length:543 start_codon:yes stop_codon:yes gene_type:complete